MRQFQTDTSTLTAGNHCVWDMLFSMECVGRCSYMAQEAVTDTEWMVTTALQLLKEVLTVEVHQFFQVAKDDAALSPKVLGQVRTLHLGEIVVNNVTQGTHIFALCRHHFIHDVPQFTERKNRMHC